MAVRFAGNGEAPFTLRVQLNPGMCCDLAGMPAQPVNLDVMRLKLSEDQIRFLILPQPGAAGRGEAEFG